MAVIQNKPETPNKPDNGGPVINANIKAKPILIPMVAIIFVRCSGRDTSATKAIPVDAIAPMPCTALPMTTP